MKKRWVVTAADFKMLQDTAKEEQELEQELEQKLERTASTSKSTSRATASLAPGLWPSRMRYRGATKALIASPTTIYFRVLTKTVIL